MDDLLIDGNYTAPSTNFTSIVDQHDSGVVTAPWYVWLGLIVIAAVSFWSQATTTEERFVPALNLVANKFNIPSDVAGATLMAAGASSPELFSSFVALFVTHSSLGLGTIVGSEIFNQLIICAGAIAASKTGYLQLNPAILIREVFFYGLSIVTLFFALQNHGPVPDDNEDHIFISFWQALMVFGGYILYVFVCAYMDPVTRIISSIFGYKDKDGINGKTDANKNYGSIDGTVQATDLEEFALESMPFLQQFEFDNDEPDINFKNVQLAEDTLSMNPTDDTNTSQQSSNFFDSLKQSDSWSLRKFDFLMASQRPSASHGLYDVEMNTFHDQMSCFMWQRSYFYNKSRFATNGWALRWFTFTPDTVTSVPNRNNSDDYVVEYPLFHKILVDEHRQIIQLVTPSKKTRDYIFLAPSRKILKTVVEKMQDIVNHEDNKERISTALEMSMRATDSSTDIDSGAQEEVHAFESLIAFPVHAGSMEMAIFIFLFPLRLLMQYTIPDVRVLDRHGNPKSTLFNATISIIMCLVWLIVGSYAMVASLEALAELLDIPDSVIGVSVSAAGTSLPNYVASRMAAEQGFGNMAVSNAFGSNTFNIMVGLGLPWLIYTGMGFKPYHDLRDEGVDSSVFILALVLLLFIGLVIPGKFVLYKWHSYLFAGLYVAYLLYATVPSFLD